MFLELEQNEFLIYCYQNNLWWVFAGAYSVIIILLLLIIVVFPKRSPKLRIIIRAGALLPVITQLLQPVLYYLLK